MKTIIYNDDYLDKKDINKDSFVVSDINHDGTPDVLLTSNNGKVFTLIDFQA